MKILRTTLLIALAVATFSPTWAEDSDDVKQDLARLQGEWYMMAGTADGYPIPDSLLQNSKRICKDGELTVIIGGHLNMKAKISIDPAHKPKTVDFDVTAGPHKGKKLLGIYELEGDTLKSCFGAPGETRPTDFTSESGDHRTSTVWKREKPAAKPEK
jgi:uncharacterized protein (TIGR03067 family)